MTANNQSSVRAVLRVAIAPVLILAIAAATSSSPMAASTPSVAAPTNRLPSSSEVFDLRSKCAKLGEKLLANDIHGPAVYIEAVSSYNPRTNRCHVTLTSQPADLSLPGRYMNVTLYDGQTGEMLAFYKINKGLRDF